MTDKPAALYYHERANLTFYWQRGAPYMLAYQGNQLNGASGPVVSKVPVPPNGWIDQAEVRNRAEAWLAESNGHRRQGR